MNKRLLIKICVLIFAMVSIHLFSLSHSQMIHQTKVIADHESQQDLTKDKSDNNEDKFLHEMFGNIGLLLALLLFSMGILILFHGLQNIRLKGFILAVFYQSSYLDLSFVHLPEKEK